MIDVGANGGMPADADEVQTCMHVSSAADRNARALIATACHHTGRQGGGSCQRATWRVGEGFGGWVGVTRLTAGTEHALLCQYYMRDSETSDWCGIIICHPHKDSKRRVLV